MNSLPQRLVSLAALALVGSVLVLIYWDRGPKNQPDLNWPEEEQSSQLLRLIVAALERVESRYPPGTPAEKFQAGDREFYQQQLIHKNDILEKFPHLGNPSKFR
jgi:hypothetical protein